MGFCSNSWEGEDLKIQMIEPPRILQQKCVAFKKQTRGFPYWVVTSYSWSLLSLVKISFFTEGPPKVVDIW